MTDPGGSSTPSGPIKVWNIPIESYTRYAHDVEETKTAIATDSLASQHAATSTRVMDETPRVSAFDEWFSTRSEGIVKYEELPKGEARYYAQVFRSGLRLFGSSENIGSSIELVENYAHANASPEVQAAATAITRALKDKQEEIKNQQLVLAKIASLTQG